MIFDLTCTPTDYAFRLSPSEPWEIIRTDWPEELNLSFDDAVRLVSKRLRPLPPSPQKYAIEIKRWDGETKTFSVQDFPKITFETWVVEVST